MMAQRGNVVSPIHLARLGREKAIGKPMKIEEVKTLPSVKPTGVQREGRHRQKNM